MVRRFSLSEIRALPNSMTGVAVWLRSQGFETDEINDGTQEATFPWPTITIKVHPWEMVTECERLNTLLRSLGVEIKEASAELDNEIPSLEAVYCSAKKTAHLVLMNVTDESAKC